LDTEQGSSEEAKAILKLTGYPMPSKAPYARNMNSISKTSKEILTDRRLVFQKIAPTMTEMEKRKGIDIKQWENDTGCRVEKSSRSGKYRYYGVKSNQRVSSQEYKQRYMTVIEEGRADRAARAQLWMDMVKLENQLNNIFDPIIQSNPDESYLTKTLANNEMKQKEAFLPPRSDLSRGSSTGSIDGDYGTAENRDVGVKLASNIFANCASIMKPSTESRTIAMTQTEIGPAEIVEVSSEDTDESSSRASTPSPVPTVFSTIAALNTRGTTAQAVLIAQSRDEGIDEDLTTGGKMLPSDVPLLPFPSRDVESMDPDIAQAERRLWEKIDIALQEYSEEVMIIMKAKHCRAREPTMI
jgi:hypothetical protein